MATTLDVVAFDTEAYNDELTVGSTMYSGTSGSDGVDVAAGSFIYFSSSSSTRDYGFEICAETSASDDSIDDSSSAYRLTAAAMTRRHQNLTTMPRQRMMNRAQMMVLFFQQKQLSFSL